MFWGSRCGMHSRRNASTSGGFLAGCIPSAIVMRQWTYYMPLMLPVYPHWSRSFFLPNKFVQVVRKWHVLKAQCGPTISRGKRQSWKSPRIEEIKRKVWCRGRVSYNVTRSNTWEGNDTKTITDHISVSCWMQNRPSRQQLVYRRWSKLSEPWDVCVPIRLNF